VRLAVASSQVSFPRVLQCHLWSCEIRTKRIRKSE